ncbi:transcriptional repressor [Thermosulfuriphilus sp.]
MFERPACKKAHLESLHQREREEFEKIFSATDTEDLADRKAIFEAFIEKDYHVSPEELFETLKERGFSRGLDFIKETLDLLCRYGFAQAKSFEGQPTLYEHRHLEDHHDHFICTKCGRIIEFVHPPIEALQEEVARLYGFKPLSHKLEIYGICSSCQTKREPTLPLTMASPGERVRFARFLGGEKLRSRLTSMGLQIGDTVEVINNCGPVIVSAKGTRLALGRGLAQKILVSLCRE